MLLNHGDHGFLSIIIIIRVCGGQTLVATGRKGCLFTGFDSRIGTKVWPEFLVQPFGENVIFL